MNSLIKTTKQYKHGGFGNVKECIDYGSDNSIKTRTVMSYQEDLGRYIIDAVTSLKVYNSGNEVMRERNAVINANGDIGILTINNNNGQNTEYQYYYDDYGNVIMTILPSGLEITYTYDEVLHRLPIQTSNSLGYISYADYDYKHGKPILTIDINGNRTEYSYDKKGRLKSVRCPKEKSNNVPYTIKYEYWDEYAQFNVIPWAMTSHYDGDNPGNDIRTLTFSDGLGRIVQTKKDVEIDGVEKFVVSGKIEYDMFGRVTKKYYPTVQSINNYTYSIERDNIPPTMFTYDLLDRVLLTKYPDNSTVINSYGAEDNQFVTIVTDENGNTTIVYRDYRGLKTRIEAPEDATTMFEYDDLGQLIRSVDPDGVETFNYYDQQGNRVHRYHPSSGYIDWDYDGAGQLIRQSMSGEDILYEYDKGQLLSIVYPTNPANNVYNTYGQERQNNNVGRLSRQQDGSGVKEYSYDNMGNVTLETSYCPLIKNGDVVSIQMRWIYDSWGRIKNIYYPDGEIVTYKYNSGGKLKRIESQKYSLSEVYISYIRYDKFEDREIVSHGNGGDIYYSREPNRRRLREIASDNYYYDYKYDKVGNIRTINSDNTLNDNIRFFSRKNYNYDGLNRLVSSTSTDNYSNYNINMTYSPSGKILQKVSKGLNMSGVAFDEDFSYVYDSLGGNPYMPIGIVNVIDGSSYGQSFDIKGNLLSRERDLNVMKLGWSVDNRLQIYSDYNKVGYYTYDSKGDRAMKVTGNNYGVWQNGEYFSNYVYDNITLYVNPYLTFNHQGYTKHYFEEGSRICSKIGGGGLSLRIFIGNVIGDESLLRIEEDHARCGYHSFGQSSFYQLRLRAVLENLLPNFTNVETKESIFYLHKDHLGSTNVVMDGDNNLVHSLYYMPFGGSFGERRYHSYRTPYRFNGKDKDDESGLNYYGARYYSGDDAMWLSVDPLADKYPSLSPYVYCANNPVKLIDPDGREIWIIGEDGNKFQYKDSKLFFNGNKYEGSDGFANKTRDHLNTLKSNGMSKEIGELEASSNIHSIVNRNNNQWIPNNEENISNGVGTGSTINYNPNLLSYDGWTRSSAVGLAHELKHAYDGNAGKYDISKLLLHNYAGLGNKSANNYLQIGGLRIPVNSQNIERGEINAINTANKVNISLGGSSIRTSIQGIDIKKYLNR